MKIMLYRLKYFAALLIWTSSFLSCKKHKSYEGGGAAGAGKGYATGRVLDAAGKPLAGVKILIDNTLLYNSFLTGVTDAQGNYKIKLSPGAWIPYAILEKTYNGRKYSLYLDPEHVDGFGPDGGVCNFTWKIFGLKKGTLTGFNGGNVILTRAVGSQLYDSENIQYTFGPTGPLIDGSTGSVLYPTEAPGMHQLIDIPIGRYVVTATYQGKALQLRDRYSNGAFNNHVIIDFEPNSPDGNNMAAIDYKE